METCVARPERCGSRRQRNLVAFRQQRTVYVPAIVIKANGNMRIL